MPDNLRTGVVRTRESYPSSNLLLRLAYTLLLHLTVQPPLDSFLHYGSMTLPENAWRYSTQTVRWQCPL